MSGRIRKISGQRRETLRSGWELARCDAGRPLDPATASGSLEWQPIDTLATVAAALRARGEWSLDHPARRFDADDWWYRLRFAAPAVAAVAAAGSKAVEGSKVVLGFDGLATVADAWLNGEPLLHSENMFHEHEVEVGSRLIGSNELLLRFHSLDSALAAKRPRPRWRTPMVENQQLRWFRTTLLGRTPGWSPPAAAVGPWRPIWLEVRDRFEVSEWSADVHVTGTTGVIVASCRIVPHGDASLADAVLVATRGTRTWRAPLQAKQVPDVHCVQYAVPDIASLHCARLEIPEVERWWPHTHGEPALYELRLELRDRDPARPPCEVELGATGFRTVSVDTSDGNFAVHVNGVPVFCRGACWTPLDCVSLDHDGSEVDAAVEQARAAGMNMLRVGGTMTYESGRFLDACDRNGMLLWQDFMFANMDYPEGDATFEASVTREARQQLRRLAGRPCLAVLCGNSEGEQQAAMWGAPRELWSPPLFHRTLKEIAAALAPHVPYWPSSAHGGAFPHQGDTGTTSYYGVGAYRRPVTDARRSAVRFASECLAFANVPEDFMLDSMTSGNSLKVHHPQWKARVPRDLGAGWDFDDVRDHYLGELFGVAPLDLRYADHDRYVRISRAASGEAMAAAFREWRRAGTACNGALIWFLRDLWAGAGWGVVDSAGTAKSPYHFLRRVLQPRTIFFTDEGTNGLRAHVTNEAAESLSGFIEIAMFRNGETPVGRKREAITVPARTVLAVPVTALLDGFTDLTYAYRFGPPGCDLVAASLLSPDGTPLARDFHFPLGHSTAMEPDLGLSAVTQPLPNGDWRLTLSARRTARFVTVQAQGFTASDQYFHLAPATPYEVLLQPSQGQSALKGFITALNGAASCKLAASR